METIRADYVASEDALASSRDEDRRELETNFGFQGGEDYHHATPANIDVAMTFLCEKYGSVDGYLDAIGFDGEWRRKLRECLR